MKFKTKDMLLIAMSVALIALGAMIRIPSPVAGFFTLQLPFVIMIGVLLGPQRGAMAALVYMIGGLMGIPWFAAGGGLGYLLKPTFGFIISFIFAAWIAGHVKASKNTWKSYALTLCATIVVWVYGMVHYTFILNMTTGTDLTYYTAIVGILSPDFYTDIILTLVFTKLAERISKAVEV